MSEKLRFLGMDVQVEIRIRRGRIFSDLLPKRVVGVNRTVWR